MRVGNVKEIVFSKDPKQMNWLREEFPYAEVKCPPEFSAEVQNEKDGDVLTTKIVVSYNGAHPYFTNAGSIGVSFPLQDRYTGSVTCRDYRCHAHVFCGENTSYIMALRMGGAAPHLGMVLTKGSLSAYSIERDLKLQSNDRGCFWLHPSAQEFAPGDTMKLEWKVFPHRGREDFREKLRAFPRVILVDAEQYVIYPGETSKVTIEPTFPAEKVTINGASLEKTENGVYEYLFENEKTGEYVLSICADEVKTTCRLLVQERPETLAAKRCAFIVDHQQYHGKIKELQGAYLPIDYVRGYEHVLDTLASEFPDVTFQACSSGGGRADYGTMRRHHEFWTSDNTDAYERVFMQWGIGHLFPAISMAAHVTASPNHQTGRSAPLKFRFDVAMSGRLGFELQPCDMTEEDMAFSKRALTEYKRIRPVVQFGDLYRLSSPYESRVASLMYVCGKRAVVFAWLMDKWLADSPPPLRLKGLNPVARYLVREINMNEDGSLTNVHEQVLGGDFLMDAGIRIRWKKAFQSVCLEVAETNPDAPASS